MVDTAEADSDGSLTSLVFSDDAVTSGVAEVLTPDYWKVDEKYGGPFDVCWVIAPSASQDTFELVYTPSGYVWGLGVFSMLGEPTTHHVFVDPVEGDRFETEGYDQVIACKNVDADAVGGGALSRGYWKTHSAYGPASYDGTWALVGPRGRGHGILLEWHELVPGALDPASWRHLRHPGAPGSWRPS